VGHRRIAHPGVEMIAQNEDGQEQHEHQRQTLGGGLQYSANTQAPQAAERYCSISSARQPSVKPMQNMYAIR